MDNIAPAPKGQIYVCACCGKKSRDRYGAEPIDHGWDESCVLHAVLCYEKKNPDGSWKAVQLKN